MIKMKSHHPLLVDGEARTEFETNEQHARELELSGLAVRVDSAPVEPEEMPHPSDVPELAVEPASPDAPAEPDVALQVPPTAPAPTPAKTKKAKQ